MANENENETVEQLCEVVGDLCSNRDGSFETIDGERVYVTLLAERILAAHKHELAAKDAEIEDLKAKNTEAFKVVLKRDKEIRDRDALIKELADDLSGYICDSECNGVCASFGNCCSKTSRQIIAKAREVIGENHAMDGAERDGRGNERVSA